MYMYGVVVTNDVFCLYLVSVGRKYRAGTTNT